MAAAIEVDIARANDDQSIDAGFHLPLASRAGWIAIRAAAMVTAAAVLSFAPGVDRRWALVAALLAGVLAQPIMLWVSRGRDVSHAIAVSDLVLAGVLVVLMPSLYPAAALWVGSLLTWQAITSSTRVATLIGAISVVAFGAAGWAAGITGWWMVTTTHILLGAAYLVFGHTLRVEVRENEVDLLATVSVGGAIVHRSSVGDGTAMQVHGDIEALTGYTRDEWIGLDHRSLIHPDDVDHFWIDAAVAQPGTIIDRIGRLRRADGTWMWMRDVSRVTLDRNGNLSFRGFSFDATEAQENQAELRRQTRRDAMTGLPNRVALDEAIADRLDAGEAFAMLLVDLNRFKEVNDTLGHEAGDHVIEVIGSRLSTVVSDRDVLARMGGDEFALLIGGATAWHDVRPIGEEIAARCRQPIYVRGISVALSASIGATFADATSDRATLLRHADIAMYDAKRSGSAIRLFDQSLERTSTMQLSLSADLPGAVERGDIQLYFQPQFDLRTNELIGAEGLVRWAHHEFGLLTPATFLDLALMSEGSAEFVRATLRQAIAAIATSIEVGHPTPVAVNVSIASLRDLDVSSTLFTDLAHHGVPPELLTVEITENDVDQPSDAVIAVLDELRSRGVTISIDDFGTGHSSLERLRTMHVDELKLDRAFVASLCVDERDRQIVQTIIDLANRLGTSVVAEGVEHADQIDQLLAMGCHRGQGFHFSPAVDRASFDRMVAAAAHAASATRIT